MARIHELTGISRRTIQRAIANGELKATKLGGATAAYVIYEEDLHAWQATREQAVS